MTALIHSQYEQIDTWVNDIDTAGSICLHASAA